MKQEKFESILNIAKKMFARYGLRKTSMDELARMARVAKATIYNYFGSKDKVYMEVLRRESDEIVEKLLNLDREGIEKLLPAAEEIRNQFFEREVDIIRSILKEGVEEGVFHLRDVLLTARAIGHALRGFEINWLVQESEERIDHYLDELMSILLYGLMSEKRCVAKA